MSIGFAATLNPTLVFRNDVVGSNPVYNALYASRTEFRDSNNQLWTPQSVDLSQSIGASNGTYTITADASVTQFQGLIFRVYNQYKQALPVLKSYFLFSVDPKFAGIVGLGIKVSGTYTPGSGQTADSFFFTVTPPPAPPNTEASSAFVSFQVMFTAAGQNFISHDPQICLEGNG